MVDKYKSEPEEKTSNDTFEFKEDNTDEVVAYLNNKYNKNFDNVERVKAYCLKVGKYNLSYNEECTTNDIVNYIYKVKIDNDREFYVKEVTYSNKVVVPEIEKRNETKGFYDNYIGYVIGDKIASLLSPRYRGIFDSDIMIKPYKGLGISNISENAPLQYLDNSYQNIKNEDVSIEEFVDSSNATTVGLSVKINSDITENNFKDIVTKISTIRSLAVEGIFIDSIILEFNNDNRYIYYDNDLKILELKRNMTIDKDVNNSVSVYDRSICLNNEKTLDCITYNEFMAIDNNNLNFSS